MPATPTPKSLHTIPIPSRPSTLDIHQCLSGLAYVILFNLGCLMIHGSQLFVLVPLRAVLYVMPWPHLQRLHESGVRQTKQCFVQLLVLMTQWFAPTRVLLTFEGDNIKEEDVLVRDVNGRVVKLNLPEKMVLIANHQIYADWIYLWFLTYIIGNASDVLIILKDSLKWIPVIGWAMQCFHFIFLARSWASDKLQLSEKLSKLAARAQLQSSPLALMIFPEGTLVSKLTRPISKKFSDKNGIEDMRHMLLPRSTGLLYCLRSLSPEMPDLHLLDITVAYEGIPPLEYGQSYYTLRSIFLNGVPPPRIHMHLRLFNVKKDVPIGIPSSQASLPVSPAPKKSYPSPEETATFEVWLQTRWREKDDLLEFLETKIPDAHEKESLSYASSAVTEIPMELQSAWEIPQAFAAFAPVVISKLVRRLCRCLF
ncbi:acyltransferase-domain-containing protein [Hysterangium stoloniferum]|nr:acyltransferase-domain-containing protein [Hysterangium stoloniferum]